MSEARRRRDHDLIRAKINLETAQIPWRELQRFFAAGKVLRVAAGLDLVAVACAIERDDVARVADWTGSDALRPVGDDEARQWIESDARLWAVVVKPWVLVQPPETGP